MITSSQANLLTERITAANGRLFRSGYFTVTAICHVSFSKVEIFTADKALGTGVNTRQPANFFFKIGLTAAEKLRFTIDFCRLTLC